MTDLIPLPVIRVSRLSKRFVIRKEKSLKERLLNLGRSNLHKEDFYALNDVSFEVEPGTTLGLIGPNGSGKSTLLKMIGGIIQPTVGTVEHRGRVAALLELGAGFHPDLTGRENVYLNAAILGLSKAETDSHFDEILDFSGIERFIDTQVKFYSSGMYVRLAFAVAVHVNPDILIIDEVLAVGDEPFQRKCMDRIRDFQRSGKTIVLVTHSLDQVAEFCDRAIVLESGQVKFDGNPGDAIKTLRTDFEVIRQEHDQASAVLDGQSRPSIEKVELMGSAGDQPINSIHSGQGLAVEVTLKLPAQTTNWIVGIGIESAMGQVIFGINSELLGVDPTPISGTTVVRFDIQALTLGRGQYFVHASYGTLSGGELFRVPQANSFSVSSATPNVGIISAASSVRVLTTVHSPAG